jgi:hypothetical protein
MAIQLSELQKHLGPFCTRVQAAAMLDVMESNGFDLAAMTADAISEIPPEDWQSMCCEAFDFIVTLDCGDPACPCQDGDVCHYVTTATTPAMVRQENTTPTTD